MGARVVEVDELLLGLGRGVGKACEVDDGVFYFEGLDE